VWFYLWKLARIRHSSGNSRASKYEIKHQWFCGQGVPEVSRSLILPLRRVLVWLTLLNSLAVKYWLHCSAFTDRCCVVFHKPETIRHVLWNCPVARRFWAWITAEYNILLVAHCHWKGVLFWEKWMVQQVARNMKDVVRLMDLFFLWQCCCRATFHEASSLFN